MRQDPSIVIRGGTIVDGTGSPPVVADIAIAGDRIVELGQVSERGAEEIDARGLVVTPGFIDLHTHYDAQVTWAEHITPSSCQGVTTILMQGIPGCGHQGPAGGGELVASELCVRCHSRSFECR